MTEKQPETLARLQASRAGYRAHLTQTLKKSTSILQKESLTDKDIVSLKRIVEQLSQKKSKLLELDEKIVNVIEEPKELEKEVFQTEDIQEEIDDISAQISNAIEQFASIKVSPSISGAPTLEEIPVGSENTNIQIPATENTNDETNSGAHNGTVHEDNQSPLDTQTQQENLSTTHAVNTLASQATVPTHPTPTSQMSRLPKLNLPTFSGNPLYWFTFWDSFEAAVHSNSTLGNVQKFSYLKAQLVGDASRAIAGFPLTNNNYNQAIQLLKDRFGQPSKIINAHMQCLLDLPDPSYELASLQLFQDTIETHVRGLEALGRSHETYGDLLVPIILGKLPQQLRTNLARDHVSPEWKFAQLREAIVKEIRILEAGVHTKLPNSAPHHYTITNSFITPSQRKPPYGPRHRVPPTPPPKCCAYCKGPHPSHHCSVVKDCQERWSIAKRDKLCFNCLGSHKSSKCQSRFRCLKCKGKHHTTLCSMPPSAPTLPVVPPSPSTLPPPLVPPSSVLQSRPSLLPPPLWPPSTPYIHCNPSNQQAPPHTPTSRPTTSTHATLVPSTNSPSTKYISLLKTTVAPVSAGQTLCDANILFDEGAQRSFITTKLADQIRLSPTETEEVSLSAFGAQTTARRHLPVATVYVITLTGDRIPLKVLVVDEIAAPLQIPLRQSVKEMPHLKNLTLAYPLTTQESFDISLLIGADHYWDLVEDKVIRGPGPTAVASKLGYLLSGPLPTTTSPYSTSVNLLQTVTSTKKTELDLECFWSLESIGISPPSTKQPHQDFLEDYINTSVTQNPDGSYSAKFPWKPEAPVLPNNYAACERRTRGMIRRLATTPDLLKSYGDIIEEQTKRGFIEKVYEAKATDKAHYIPHHPIKKESTTTPVRIVFDCSFHSSPSSPSLNDCLLTGPPFLNDMCAILVRFRTFPYGLSADVEKAFLHVGLDDNDRDFTRFLWLSDPTNPESMFDIYRFKTVLFGSTSSPFMLNATLLYHLQQYEHPVAKDITENIYVDNIISGCDKETDTIPYYNTARSIMSAAHFNLHSWASNSPSLQAVAVKDETADTKPVVNILGLKWNPSTDTLSLTPTQDYTPPPTVTKRHVLQSSSKVYDPLGILSPTTVKAKLLIQELWQNNLEWDEPLPNDLTSKWISIAQDLHKATNLSIQRRYFSHPTIPTSTTYLHVFADASIKAYGAVAYLTNGDQSSFIMAKSRIAPLKKLTLPQLELMAAVIATRLADFLFHTISSRYPTLKVKLWSDSEIALHWIHSNKLLKQFITHRVKEIKSLFPPSTWNHCPTDQNPADLLTRGITATQLQASSLWKFGPPWLLQESKWPSWTCTRMVNLTLLETNELEPLIATNKPESPRTIPSETTPDNTVSGIHHVIDTSRYSSVATLLAVTAYVYRFIRNIRKEKPKDVGPLSAKEKQAALKAWIKNCQTLNYNNEIANLKSRTSSRLPLVRQLRLFLDCDGLLRCGGRIHNAPLSELAKFPYLLPKNSRLTELIVYDTHLKQLHSGVSSTVTALRQRYWITAMRQYVKKLIRGCIICRKVSGEAFKNPDPAPLPKARVQQSRPFAVTGVDFAGPLYVRSDSGEEKSYVCLFTCAVTRAVHLEIVTDLSEQQFLLAFRRFSSRKSLPLIMISDNASTYLASAETLKELFESPSLKNIFSRQGIEWHFIPKRAPWYGGFWERLVGLTKNTLRKVLGRASVTLEELQTIIVEVEAILNDRPITFVSSDIQDEEPLTPSHLLYGRRITSLPFEVPISMDDLTDPDYGSDSNVKRRVKLQAIILKRFWDRWRHEYLTSLREFHRSSGDNKQVIKEGDVVLVHDDTPRSTWKMAIVENLIKGRDGLVRAASIRTRTGFTNRPICKLYPLELSTSTQTEKDREDRYANVIVESTETQQRPKRASAMKATEKISEWARTLRAAPEDVEDYELDH